MSDIEAMRGSMVIDLVQFQIDLRKQFEQAADDKTRKTLLRHLRKALEQKS